jgi:hypothetical protein
MYKLSSLLQRSAIVFSSTTSLKSTHSERGQILIWVFSLSFAISSFDYVDGASPSKINLCRALLSQQSMHLHACIQGQNYYDHNFFSVRSHPEKIK